MGNIDTSKKLFKAITEKVILFLATFGLAGLGVVRMLIPNLANPVYTTLGYIAQVMLYILLVGIFIAGIADVVEYFRNRGKPKNVSLDTEAISNIKVELKNIGEQLKILDHKADSDGKTK